MVNIYRTNIFTKDFTNKSKCLPKYQKNKKYKNNVNVNVNDNVNVKWVNFVRASPVRKFNWALRALGDKGELIMAINMVGKTFRIAIGTKESLNNSGKIL